MIGTLQKEGPVKAATFPSRCPANQRDPLNEGYPNMDAARFPTHTVRREALAALPAPQLRALFDVLGTVHDILQASGCQPRFLDARGAGANGAGEELDDLASHVGHFRDLIVEVVEGRDNAAEAGDIALLRLRDALEMGSLEQVRAFLSNMGAKP